MSTNRNDDDDYNDTDMAMETADGTTTTTAATTSTIATTNTTVADSSMPDAEAAAAAPGAATITNMTFDSNWTMEQHKEEIEKISSLEDDLVKYKQLKIYFEGLSSVLDDSEESESLFGKVSRKLRAVGNALSEQCSDELSALNLTDDKLNEIMNSDKGLTEKKKDVADFVEKLERFMQKWDEHIPQKNRDTLLQLLNKSKVELQRFQCSNELLDLNLTEEELNTIINSSKSLVEKKKDVADFVEKLERFMQKWDEHIQKKDLLELDRLLRKSMEELQKFEPVEVKASDRVASIIFAIIDQKYIGKRDLEAFGKRVEELFTWHGEKEKKEYIAPYFPIIQSSGMGKTKLMFTYREEETKLDNGRNVVLILCKSVDNIDEKNDKHYNHTLHIPKSKAVGYKVLVPMMNDWADAARTDKKNKQVVFLFDEAHHLLAHDGIPFRTIRWWLRLTTNNNTNAAVAVFAGTNSGLANFYSEPPNSDQSRNPKSSYHDTDVNLYEPFFEISTIGLLRQIANKDHVDDTTDYEKAICYGRPLFTLLHRSKDTEDTLENAMSAILKRMLLSQTKDTWENDESALLSILATRVQMGQTSASVVSTLVSQGYANLTFFASNENNQVARFCYFPDPVCARLAMRMMDHEWKSEDGYCGKEPKFWTEKAFEMFANGMCTPNKGDLGEIAAAFYLLYCGDILRKAIDSKYKTFGVSFQKWLYLLKNPTGDASNSVKEKVVSAKVSFIQCSRLYLLLPLTELLTQEFLEDLYKSGTACFLYPACPVFDLVASIQRNTGGTLSYEALLISVKAHKTFTKGKVEEIFKKFNCIKEEIKMAFKNKNDPHCMLILIGAESEIKKPVENKLWVGNYLVYVPSTDPFGVTNLVVNSTDQAERSEIYSSHCYLPSFASRDEDEEFQKLFVRKKPAMNTLTYLMEMLKQMASFKSSSPTQEDTTDVTSNVDLPMNSDEVMRDTEIMTEHKRPKREKKK